MSDPYAFARSRVALKLRQWNTGVITLTKATPGTVDPTTPWIPAEPTLDVYSLDARVDGVAAEFIDNETILATDLVVIASPKATHTLTDGDPADGAVVDVVPRMADVLKIGGAQKVIKRIEAVPAAGAAARFHIFVAS
jgi:hypothetical protein